MAAPASPLGRTRSRLRQWARRKSLEDIFQCSGHSRDFTGSRAEYITLRLRLLAAAFAVLALAWVPMDALFLDERTFHPILAQRIGFSLGFLFLALWNSHKQTLWAARLRLAGLVLIPAVFFVTSRHVLGEGSTETGVLVGYSFLPYLMVALAGIFPLTLVEGSLYALAVGMVKVGSEAYFGTLWEVHILGEIWLLGLLAVIALWAELAQLHMLLALYREATRDALTGLVNRRPLTRWLEGEVREASDERRTLSLLLFDLDLFKRINDTHGHLAGDSVLARFATLLTERLPEPELVGRWGGEEFLAALPDLSAAEAHTLAEGIRTACHEQIVESPDGKAVRFTVSIGVAELREGESLEELLNRVDNGLYAAKASGRDMVVMA
ncbi:GGDEF domain-containing protein [Endothiovibrio diazotrophicus]